MSKVKLKPCPFCGGEARLEQIPGATWDKFVVTCKSKKCCAFYIGYCDEGLYDTRTKAIEAWNTRKPMENKMKQNEIYMLITTDRYELPVAVADTVKELAFLIGVTENNIRSAMSKAKKRETRCRYVKVVIEEEEK